MNETTGLQEVPAQVAEEEQLLPREQNVVERIMSVVQRPFSYPKAYRKDYEYLIYEKDGEIATATMNYPERLNVQTFKGFGGVLDDLMTALHEEAEYDDDVKVVILKGAGRAFCAGGDISQAGFVYGMGTNSKDGRLAQRIGLMRDRQMFEQWEYLLYFPKVVIAQVHGHALGSGMLMVQLADLAIASDDAKFQNLEHRMGHAGSGLSDLLLLLLNCGYKKYREHTLLAPMIDALEAERLGLVNKVVPREQLDGEVMRCAKAVCLLPADGIAIGKAHTRALLQSLGVPLSNTAAYITHTLYHNVRFKPDETIFFRDRRELGTKAAIQKRDARWTELGF